MDELVKPGIIERRNFLGEKGREWVNKNLGLHFDHDPLPEGFDSIIKELPDEFSYLNDIKTVLENRPPPEFALDQSLILKIVIPITHFIGKLFI